MKQLFFAILIVLLGLPMLAQEVHFPPAVLAGGGASPEDNVTNISRWRLSQVHVITLPGAMSFDDELIQVGLIKVYPNPVKDFLNIEFKMEESNDYIIKLTDVLGRTLLIQDQRTIFQGQVIELNMAGYKPADWGHPPFPAL
jgi:hypothetical protein